MSKETAKDLVLLTVDARGVATATLNRPEVGNAYNEDLLAELIAGLQHLARDPTVRCLVLRGAGRHFQAGADINWLGRAANYGARAELRRVDGDDAGDAVAERVPQADDRAGARRVFRRRRRHGVLRRCGLRHAGRAVRPDRGARRVSRRRRSRPTWCMRWGCGIPGATR